METVASQAWDPIQVGSCSFGESCALSADYTFPHLFYAPKSVAHYSDVDGDDHDVLYVMNSLDVVVFV